MRICIESINIKARPRVKLADHQSLLPQAQGMLSVNR